MGEPMYVSHATVKKLQGVHRRARLHTGATVEFGVHGPIKAHYQLHDESDLPLPVDYVVAATGG